MPKITINVNVKSIRRFKKLLEAELRGDGNGPLGRSLIKAGYEYAEYVQSRFATGGGSEPWRPLHPRTIKKKGHGVILIDTGTLEDSFATSSNIRRVRNGVSISLRSAAHPNSKLNVAQLAMLHHNGAKNLPSRPIWVNPDHETQAKINRTVSKGIRDSLREAGAGK